MQRYRMRKSPRHVQILMFFIMHFLINSVRLLSTACLDCRCSSLFYFSFRPPKISKSPSPIPFFPRTSLVADFYHGQLGPVFERVAESDVSFLMYYAPWDAESQATRMQFKIVAQYYYKQVCLIV